MIYTKASEQALKEAIYQSKIHDSVFTKCSYDKLSGHAEIIVKNEIDGVRITFAFSEIRAFVSFACDPWGTKEGVLCLSVESPDCAGLADVSRGLTEDSLYCVFQMFSGNELRIACKKVQMETEDYELDEG